jgi:hypothetical protein
VSSASNADVPVPHGASLAQGCSEDYLATMPVGDDDRDYFRRIGEAKQRSHDEALRSHLASPLRERLRRSFEMSAACTGDAVERGDDPTPFYDTARRLGLYKP